MKYVTVQLPPVQQSLPKPLWFTTAPKVSLWFQEHESRDICMKALGLADVRVFLLQSGEYQLESSIFVGSAGLAKLSEHIPRIFYLSSRMFSGELYFAKPQKAIDSYSFCLLNRIQLGQHDGESSHLDDFYDDAKRIFHTTPFLGRNVAEDYLALKQWLADIVLLINVKQLKELSARRLNTAHDYAEALLCLNPSGRIEQVEQLVALLALRQHGSNLATYIGSVTATKSRAFDVFEPLPNALHTTANDHIEKTYQYAYKLSFKPTLGKEVLPALRRASRAVRKFAENLKHSPHSALQNIGEEILGHLETRTPILALTGTFSSGKTTLLNSLLMGQDNSHIRAFRTKPGANTAIVSEITSVGGGNTNQHVEFEYRKKINNFCLATITPNDSKILKDYVQEIYGLLERGVLTNAELKIMPLHLQIESRGSLELHSAHDIQKVLRHLFSYDQDERAKRAQNQGDEGIYIFSADVIADALAKEFLRPPNEQQNADGTVQYRLPRAIDLTNDESWEDFQGKPSASQTQKVAGRVKLKQNIKHWTELDIASLLIERSRVYLNHSLLELTTIADTPGTDSSNSGHDYVTKEYLQSASAYILLLPTLLVDSKRTNADARDDLNADSSILGQLAHTLNGDMRRIAFVVNCFPMNDEHANIEDKIRKYEQIVCKAFKMHPSAWAELQHDPARQNFFVVQLKGIQEGERPELFHGYPSLIPLQTWVEKTFRSGKYRERYDTLLKVLSSEWQQNYLVWVQKLQTLHQEAEERQRLCESLRRFMRDLQGITETHLDDIQSFRQSFTQQGRSVTRMMQTRGTEPKRYKKREDLTTWRDELKEEYAELNDLLQNFADLHALEAWIREVKDKARLLPIALPALVPEDPAAQSPSWNHNRRFAIYDVNDKFAKVAEQWPENAWQKFIGFFTDSRNTLVKELQSFWEDQYEEIWAGGLETYLTRCKQFLEKQQQAVQTTTQEFLEQQERLNDPELRKRLEQEFISVIAAFDALANERQDLYYQLHQALVSV